MAFILRWLKRLTIAFVVILMGFYAWLWWQTKTASVSTHGDVALGDGNIIIPTERTRTWAQKSTVTDSLLALWANREMGNWATEGKMTIPRILMGKLGSGQEIDFVNTYLQKQQPRGTVGSTGPFHKTGDYDFTLAGLSLLLYAFGDQPDILYPQTVDHIVNVLMTQQGGNPIIYTPRILWLPLRDTENHILMTEGSRYLTNQWKRQHGNTDPKYDNVANGLEAFLLAYLKGMEGAGMHEYNARPYHGYTLTALLNLEAFAAEPVCASARRILDRANWEYALGSLSFRRFPPFRRQARRAVDTQLDVGYHTGIMKAWMSLAGIDDLHIRSGSHHALWVALTSYRPSDAVAQWVVQKPDHYFIQMGHGHDGSPEIYSGGPGYLITAGGVSRDRFRQSVARPTTLMLEDDAMDLTDLLHIAGPGDTYRDWNNTGVHRNFAVSAGPISIPEGWTPTAENKIWKIFEQSGQLIATHSTDTLGIFCLLPQDTPENLLEKLTSANPNPQTLKTQFQWPNGQTITYDINAPKNQWVITAINGKPVDRDHGKWPLMKGDVPGWNQN